MIERLTLTLPTSALDKMEVIEDSDNLKETLLEIIRKVGNAENSLVSLNNNIDKIENIFFISIVIKNMIETNKTFSESLKLSEMEIRKKVNRLKFSILDEKEEIVYLVSSILSLLPSYSKQTASNGKEGNKFYCTLEDLTPDFYEALKIYNVTSLTEKIIPKVCNEIKRVIVDPINDSSSDICKILINKFENEGEVLNAIDKEYFNYILNAYLNSLTKEFYLSVPFQVIISKVIEKAINEDLTFMEALLSFKFIDLVEEVIYEIKNNTSYDPEKIKEGVTKTVEFIINTML